MSDDLKWMNEAYKQAKKAELIDEVPIGAIIVKNDKVISRAYNTREKTQNVIKHAEIIAIEKACKKLGTWRLDDCTLYVTLEPCVMCTGAILNARLENVYFGAYISNGSISAEELAKRAELNHKTHFEGGFKKEECSLLVTSYFKNKRKQIK